MSDGPAQSLIKLDKIVLQKLYDDVVEKIAKLHDFGERKTRSTANHERLRAHLDTRGENLKLLIAKEKESLSNANLLSIYENEDAFALIGFGSAKRDLGNVAAHSASRFETIMALERLATRDPKAYDAHQILVNSLYPDEEEGKVTEGVVASSGAATSLGVVVPAKVVASTGASTSSGVVAPAKVFASAGDAAPAGVVASAGVVAATLIPSKHRS